MHFTGLNPPIEGADGGSETLVRSATRRPHTADADCAVPDGGNLIERDRAVHADTGPPRAVLYVRGSRACCEREAAVLEDLRGLTERGAVGDVTVRTWPARITLDDVGAARGEFVAEFERFEGWAGERGVSLRPPFVVRHLDSAITRESEELLVTPALLLTLWAGDELVSIYPHHQDGLVVTVADAIEGLDRVGSERAAPVASVQSDGNGEPR